jgi:hypothetical protein
MLVLKIAAGVVLAVVLLAVGCSALVASSTDDHDFARASSSLSSEGSGSDSDTGLYDGGGTEEEASSDETAGQENARRSAESYLDTAPFSRTGLIKQLEFEGYSTADATYAVDAVSPDWNEQAARSAESYLDTQAFSRSGLISQLEFEGYTTAQAVYGVNQTGL